MRRKTIQACRQIGGMIMDGNCYVNNDLLEKADIDCQKLGGIVHEIPHNARVSKFICELPLYGLEKIPGEKLDFIEKELENE